MRKYALVLILAALLGASWFIWIRHAGDEYSNTEQVTEVAVHVGKITRATLRAYVIAYGTVEPMPAGDGPAASASVAPFVSGVVTEVRVVEGQHVTKGDVLFQLDSRVADVAVAFARKNVERQKRLLKIQGTSEKLLQEAEQQLDAALVQQALLRVESPVAGTVTQINVKPGEAVDLMTAMAEVADLNRLVVSAGVPSAELAAVKLGQTAEVNVDDSSLPVSGVIDYISPQVDLRNGTAVVRAKLPSGLSLRPGQFVSLRIVTAVHEDRLAVPTESVVRNEDGANVIAVVEGDTARQVVVQTDLRDGDLVEVQADGLQAGMTVVTEGAYGLPADTRVRILGN
jgi:membrane fusion protein, multidrug efflux system